MKSKIQKLKQQQEAIIDSKFNVIIGDITSTEPTFGITVDEITTSSLRVTGKAEELKDFTAAEFTYVAQTNTSNPIKFEHITETSYTVTGLEQGTTYTVYMIAYDNAGNERKSEVKTVTTEIDKEQLLNNIIIKPSTTECTNSNIEVEVEWNFDNPNAIKEISIDGGKTFTKYIEAVTIEKNTTIIAKMTIEETEITKELPISNIDKLEPNDFTPTISDLVSSTELTINANATDAEATDEYGSSGIKEYQYYVYQGETLIDKSDIINSSSWKASGLKIGEIYDIYIEVWDNAGNYKKSETFKYTKLEVFVWEKYSVNTTEEYIINETGSGYISSGKVTYFTITPPSDEDAKKVGQWSFSGNPVYKYCNVESFPAYGSYYGWPGIYDNSSFSRYYTGLKRVTSGGQVKIRYNKLRYITINKIYTNGNVELGRVTDSNLNAYPDDGYQDGYWYVKVNQ